MCYVNFIILFYFFKLSVSLENLEGWSYINLHCRDNDNAPVDWWYIYKPAAIAVPYMARGYNFTYITPDSAGRWQVSSSYITTNSMLQHTLAPMFRPTYADSLAVVAYDRSGVKDSTSGSLALGIMMADKMGGLWLGHTVPGLLDLSRDRPTFPQTESTNGHLLICMSVDLMTLNNIGMMLRQIEPKFVKIRIPPSLKSRLPLWNFRDQPSITRVQPKPILNFATKKMLRAIMMVRKPGNNNCLYKAFAKKMRLVLDVYGHRHQEANVCEKSYSVRNINSISLKSPERVRYITNKTDRAGFAVSTAAHWQRIGTGPVQYWVCVHSYDDGRGKGVLVVCVEDYKVWQSFDNLKIKEPVC